MSWAAVTVQPVSLDPEPRRNHEEQHDCVRSMRITPVALARKARRARPAQKLPQGTHFGGVRDTRVTCQQGGGGEVPLTTSQSHPLCRTRAAHSPQDQPPAREGPSCLLCSHL